MASDDTRLWHPFADMAAVRGHELVIVGGEDVWVWDDSGRRYLDATASLWYANVGHGRARSPRPSPRSWSQLEAYSAFGDFANPPALELAEALAERAPMDSRIFLVSGGGDAIDTAAKLARRYWAAEGHADRTLILTRTSATTARTASAPRSAESRRIGSGSGRCSTPNRSARFVEAMQAAVDRIGAAARRRRSSSSP